MGTKKYSKAELEEVIYLQFENLNAIHDLLKVLKLQNGLIEKITKKINELFDNSKDKK